jgi:hypothetical protein
MLPAGFELTIAASERPQTHALDRAATGIDFLRVNSTKFTYLKILYFYMCVLIVFNLQERSSLNLCSICKKKFTVNKGNLERVGLHEEVVCENCQ